MVYYFVLLFPGFVCLFWALALLARWRVNYSAQNVVAINLLLTAFCLFCYADYYFDSDVLWGWRTIQDMLYSLALVTIGPLYVRYFRLLTCSAKLKWWNKLIFLPSLVTAIALVALYVGAGSAQAVAHTEQMWNVWSADSSLIDPILSLRWGYVHWADIVFVLQQIYLLGYAALCLRRYRHALAGFYSYSPFKKMVGHYVILGGLLLFFVASVLSAFVPKQVFVDTPFLLVLLLFVTATAVFVVAWKAYRIRYTIHNLDRLIESVDRETGDVVLGQHLDGPRNDSSDLSAKFNHLVEAQKIFLQPNLRLDHVSRKLATNRTYISRMLEQVYGTNFARYINAKRVEYAQALMLADPHSSQEQIALRAGFANARALGGVFRQHTGISFTEWCKRHKLSQ